MAVGNGDLSWYCRRAGAKGRAASHGWVGRSQHSDGAAGFASGGERVESLRAGTLVIEAEDAPTRGYLVLYWQGKSSDRNPEKGLEPFFLQALTEAQERKLRVEMHFEKLIPFNSSTIGYLLPLIQETRPRRGSLVL